MLANLLMLNFAESDLEPQYWQRLKAVSDNVTLLSADSPDVRAELSNADGLMLKLGMSADRALIDQAPKLRYIGMLGTGYGRIDTDYAASKGVVVCNVADYSTAGVAEFTFAALLAHMREIPRGLAQAASGDYSEATFTGSEISGKTFGVVGLGHIGRRVAEMASAGFGAKTVYWSRSPKSFADHSKIARSELPVLLAEADIVSLNLEYNSDTERIIDGDALAKVKPGAILINTAPMEIIDLDALTARLDENGITFILDHSDELQSADAERLAQRENCIMYPPIAYTTNEATAAKLDIFVGNLEHFLQGSPTNQVN
ncbi:MAG TPA: NAD(P)-dependent oxidoreductase [Solirubrobacteraceae bacterium]|jgi:phosphoglycerate dehydrogenase-like enzyme